MTLTITATETLTELEGVPVRVWTGRTDGGVEVLVFVHRLAVAADQETAAFERELLAQMPPRCVERPLSVVLDV